MVGGRIFGEDNYLGGFLVKLSLLLISVMDFKEDGEDKSLLYKFITTNLQDNPKNLNYLNSNLWRHNLSSPSSPLLSMFSVYRFYH